MPIPKRASRKRLGGLTDNYVTGFGSSGATFARPSPDDIACDSAATQSGSVPADVAIGSPANGTRSASPANPSGSGRTPTTSRLAAATSRSPFTRKGGTQNRRLGGFDLQTEPTIGEIRDVWLLANEYIVTDASRFFRSRPGGPIPFRNPLAQTDGQPGVAFRWMEVEGPLHDESTTAGYRLLVRESSRESRERQGMPRFSRVADLRRPSRSLRRPADAERLLRAFMQRAYRRPVAEHEVQRYLGLVNQQLQQGRQLRRGDAGGLHRRVVLARFPVPRREARPARRLRAGHAAGVVPLELGAG